MINGRRKGMTLIEVLLAVSIAGIATVAILTGTSQCLAVFKHSADYQAAHWYLGLGELDHPLFLTNDVKTLEVEGVEYGDRFVFSRYIEDDEDEDDLFVIRTRIEWKSGNRDFREEVYRYVLQSR